VKLTIENTLLLLLLPLLLLLLLLPHVLYRKQNDL